MKYILNMAALLVLCGGAAAQGSDAPPSSAELQQCLLQTGPDLWNALKLTPDQTRRMGFVQTACREECEGAGAKPADDAISDADGSTVMAEVANILTADQYREWVQYCSGKQVKGWPE